MKIYAVILERDTQYNEWSDLYHISYLLRGAALEYIKETSAILRERVEANKFFLFKYEQYHFHVFKRKKTWKCIVTDTQYPSEACFLLLKSFKMDHDIKKHIDLFEPDGNGPSFEEKTFDSVFKENETMDDIVQKSSRLSISARHLYKTRNLYPSYCHVM